MNNIENVKMIIDSFGAYWEGDSEDSFSMVDSEDSNSISKVNLKNSDPYGIWAHQENVRNGGNTKLVKRLNEIELISSEFQKVQEFTALQIDKKVHKVFESAPNPFGQQLDYGLFFGPVEYFEEIVEKITSISGKALFSNAIAKALQQNFQPDLAKTHFNNAVTFADKLSNGIEKSYIIERIARALSTYGYYKAAIKIANKLPEGISKTSLCQLIIQSNLNCIESRD